MSISNFFSSCLSSDRRLSRLYGDEWLQPRGEHAEDVRGQGQHWGGGWGGEQGGHNHGESDHQQSQRQQQLSSDRGEGRCCQNIKP